MIEYIEELLRMLVTCVQFRSLYPAGHAVVKKEEDAFYNKLSGAFSKHKKIVIGIVGSEFVFQNVPLYKLSMSLTPFIQGVKAKGAEKIVFSKNVGRREVEAFVEVLCQKHDDPKKDFEFSRKLKSAGVTNISVDKLYEPQEEEEDRERPGTRSVYDSGLDLIGDIAKDIAKNKRIVNIKKVQEIVSNILNDILTNKASLLILTSIKKHDEHTFVHAVNVAILVLVQAEGLGLDKGLLNELGIASLLHDVGKLVIPEEILKKPGKLNDEELKVMRRHPLEGAKILAKTEGLNRMASVIAFEHHLRYDLTGYPSRDSDSPQTLGSMLTNIADYYDACRSHRHYRKGMPPEEIYEDMISKAGKDFDKDLLNNFFLTVGVYPAGTLVLLDTDEVGMVTQQDRADIKRPYIRLLTDENRKRIEKPSELSLRDRDEESGKYKKSIVRSISPFDPENIQLIPEEFKFN
jgi:HD-GYP domain-containing protein (c-di-GMP phosphodiesterase class II)